MYPSIHGTQQTPAFTEGACPPYNPVAEKLELKELMIGCRITTEMQFNKALGIADEFNQPVAKVLTRTQTVSELDLQSALLAQYMTNSGMIEASLAFRVLAAAVARGVPFDEMLYQVEGQKERQAESQTKSQTTTFTGENGIDSKDVHGNNSKTIKALVDKELLSSADAASIVRQCVVEKRELAEVLENRKTFEDNPETASQSIDLLIQARLVEPQMVPDAIERQREFGMQALKALVASDFISIDMMNAATCCAQLVERGDMTEQEAKLTLRHVARTGQPYEIAFRELGLRFFKTAEEAERNASRDVQSGDTSGDHMDEKIKQMKKMERILSTVTAIVLFCVLMPDLLQQLSSTFLYSLIAVTLLVAAVFLVYRNRRSASITD